MEKILTFKVGDEKFCLDSFNIVGIDQKTKVSSVPLSLKHHIGMMNLRGQIIPVIDLRILFDVSTETNSKEQCYIFIETESKKMACLVDTVYDVVDCKDLKENEYSNESSNLEKNNYVNQVLNLSGEIVFLLGAERLYNSISNVNKIAEKATA